MKKIAGILICIVLAFSFAGCSWQMPEKVSVKTNADYNFALGNFEKDFSADLSIDKLLKDVELPNNGKIYDYWPGKNPDDNTQRFLMYMPLQEIPIDFGKYFNEGMLNDLDSKPIIDQTISVPAISIPQISVDNIGFSTLSGKLNEIFALRGPAMTMSLNEKIQILLTSFGRSFSSIKYKKGTFVVESNLPDGAEVWIESKGNLTSHGVFFNGEANINIDGYVFYTDDLTIHFSENYWVTDPQKIFSTHMADNSEIKSVSGLTMDYPFELPLSMNFGSVKENLKTSNIEKCVLGTGSELEVKLDIPWEGVTSKYSFEFDGGFDFKSSQYSSQNEISVIPLTNAVITPNDITAKVKFELTFANAVIDFDKKSSIVAAAYIGKIASATVGLPSLDIPPTYEQDIPDNIKNVVQEIVLNECGVDVSYTNDFPQDNDITLNISSVFFDIENETGKIYGGKTESFSLLSLSEEKTRNLNDYDKFDFNVNLTLPGGESKKITVTNLETKKDYHIKLNIKPVINWTKVKINFSSDLFGEEGSGVIGTQFNPSSIFSSLDNVIGNDFSKSIELPLCKMYLYLTCPESLKEMFDPNNEGIRGSSISMYYGADDKSPITSTSTGTPITDNEPVPFLDSGDTLKFTSKPSFKYEEGTEIITSDLKSNASSLCKSLEDIFKMSDASKEEGAQLCINYNLSLGADNSVKDIYNNNSLADTEDSSIGIYAVIELPLKFKVKDGDETGAGAVIDLKKIMNKEDEEEAKDLFGREKADSMKDVEKYLDAIQSADLYYRLDAFPITTTSPLGVELILADENRAVYESDRLNISLNGGRQEKFSIDRTDVTDILNAYPLKLESATIFIPENSEISIPRTKKIDVNLQIGLKTDGTIELFKK